MLARVLTDLAALKAAPTRLLAIMYRRPFEPNHLCAQPSFGGYDPMTYMIARVTALTSVQLDVQLALKRRPSQLHERASVSASISRS
jgi:hypothetical protein